MEADEVQHITDNHTRLLETTTCGTLLISGLKQAGKLNDEEIENIDEKSGRIGKARRLYEIMVMKEGGYPALLKALEDTLQSGATKILRQHPRYCSGNNGDEIVVVANAPPPTASGTKASSIIVGKEGCTLHQVVQALGTCPTVGILHQTRATFARQLGVSEDIIGLLDTQVLTRVVTPSDALHNIMGSWKAKNGDMATLEELAKALEAASLKDCEETLLKAFGCKT